ncbi:ubiquitin-conjugating enzyme/RWD-like protein [Scheffersomyces coipomensis]|uniref:ubiquitin-conjugating enzyme/RWD-like protein n=1 Tax=Scheffersomyces coipomensis TaxID=1788519 RepID=UPI00315DD19D
MKTLISEYHKIMDHPLEKITIGVDDSNFQTWYFLIHGSKHTTYEDGLYLGAIIFPTDYPNAAPEFQMISHSGRFETRRAICMTMTAYHTESWNPTWSMEKILYGFVSFMNVNENGIGARFDSDQTRTFYKQYSKQWLYQRCTVFKTIFPYEYQILDDVLNHESLKKLVKYILNDPIQNGLSRGLLVQRLQIFKSYEKEIEMKVNQLKDDFERDQFYHRFFSSFTTKAEVETLIGIKCEVNDTYDLLNQLRNGEYEDEDDLFSNEDDEDDLPEIYDSDEEEEEEEEGDDVNVEEEEDDEDMEEKID